MTSAASEEELDLIEQGWNIDYVTCEQQPWIRERA